MKHYLLLLAISALQTAVAKPIKACAAKSHSTTVVIHTAGPEPTASTLSLAQAVPVETSVTPSSTPVAENAVPTSSGPSAPLASAASVSDSAATQGESTFYGGNTSGGTCSFTTYSIPSNLFGTAFSGQAWDSAANCGACVKVTGPNSNSITAMVVDQCPECDVSHLDLFQDAFAQLGSLSEGIISTSYEFVDCGITSPIKLHNKSGTSSHWFSMQVLNHNEPVSTLEVSTDGGSTWQKTQRAEYNFFENQSGFGTDTVDVRVTSKSGKTVTVENVSVASGSGQQASGNF